MSIYLPQGLHESNIYLHVCLNNRDNIGRLHFFPLPATLTQLLQITDKMLKRCDIHI